MARNRRLIVGLGILISAGFLFLAFQGLHPKNFIASLKDVQIGWLLVGAVVYFAAVTVIALRWGYLLRSVKSVPLIPLTGIVAIGYMGNNVYPFRAGEALRIYLLRRNHAVPVAGATTTVIVERVFDGLVMLTFILVSLLLVDIHSDEIYTVATFAAPIFLTAVVVFFLLAARPDWLRWLVARVSHFLPGRLREIATHMGEEIISGLEGLRSPVDLIGAVISSYVTWSIEASVYWIVMHAFGLNLGYPVALLVVGTVNLAGLLPASPGMLGVYEFFARAVMMAAGVDQDRALAYAIVVHVVIWLPVTLVGFILLAYQGLGWQAIRRAKELEAEVAV
jgi:uncharacterized protein (TIRG00374 family)